MSCVHRDYNGTYYDFSGKTMAWLTAMCLASFYLLESACRDLSDFGEAIRKSTSLPLGSLAISSLMIASGNSKYHQSP